MFHSQIDQLKLMIKSGRYLRAINVIPHGSQLAYSKYPNKAFKSQLSLGVQVPHKLSKSNLLDCISTCSSLHVMKSIPFLKQIVMGDEKQTLYNNVEWTRSWGMHNETSSTTLKSSLHLKKVMLYMWWNQRESSIIGFFQKTK